MSDALRKITAAPEFNVAIFSFLLNFVWEYIQAPTYAGMIEMNHWDGIKLCTSATFGDVGFALTAFWITSIVARSRQWIMAPSPLHVIVFLAVGKDHPLGVAAHVVGAEPAAAVDRHSLAGAVVFPQADQGSDFLTRFSRLPQHSSCRGAP